MVKSSIPVVFTLALSAIALLGLAGAGLYLAGAYNQTIAVRLEIERAFANVDVSLKQRHDEIPRLVEICRGYAAYESTTLERLVELRRAFDRAESLEARVESANAVGRDLGRLVAVSEAYPDLKANDQFTRLATRLTSTENEIADRRELFNAAVTAHNNWIQAFPMTLLARLLSFRPAPHLDLGVEDLRS
jgi:LemA protein